MWQNLLTNIQLHRNIFFINILETYTVMSSMTRMLGIKCLYYNMFYPSIWSKIWNDECLHVHGKEHEIIFSG